jgi:hypothetical protein
MNADIESRTQFNASLPQQTPSERSIFRCKAIPRRLLTGPAALPLFEYINLPLRKINVNENGALIHSDSLKQLGDNSGWDKRREWVRRELGFEVSLPLIWRWAKRLAERMSISEALASWRNSRRSRANGYQRQPTLIMASVRLGTRPPSWLPN